jgi:phosphohistidine phosphatase
MKLYFLRHGKAEERSEDGTDFSRKLTAEGIEEMERVAKGLARLVGGVDTIISSPLPRALQTAEISARAIGYEEQKIEISKEIASGSFGPRELERLLHGRSDNDRVLFVGHEPDFSSMVGYLTGARVEMKKAGCAYIETYGVEREGGVLRWLLTPRCLVLVGGDSD